MKQFAIFAKSEDKAGSIRKKAEAFGLIYDRETPDFIIPLGGDGTLLLAETAFPGLPKLPVRDSLICYKCHNEPVEVLFEIIAACRASIKEFSKLVGIIGSKRLIAVNEICIRNSDQRRALRFAVSVNGKKVDHELIGDGLVVATSFGSTGYFQSITRSSFMEGIGIGFNNLRIPVAPILMHESCIVEVAVERGSGFVSADNRSEMFTINKNDTVVIRDSGERCRFVTHE